MNSSTNKLLTIFLQIFEMIFNLSAPRMIISAALLATGLAGCANQAAVAECREMMAEDGTVMRFCEDGAKLTVEQLAAPARRPGPARLIDDPTVLKALSRQARSNATKISPDKLAALVCTPDRAAEVAPIASEREAEPAPAPPDNAALILTSKF